MNITKINVNGQEYPVGYNVLTLPSVPTTSTFDYEGHTFEIGEIVRVADQSSETGYAFYRLHDLRNNLAIWFGLATSTVDYSATVIVTMNSNQNESFTSGSATINYDGQDQQTLTGDTVRFTVPANKNYTVTFGTVSGYSTPMQVTGTTSLFGTYQHTVAYNTEVVTVTTTLSGVTLTVNGNTYTEPVKIAWGESYTVTGSAVAGYKVSSETITASQVSRTVTVTYNELRSGIYVMDASGNEIDAAQATSSYIGVVVRDVDKGVAFLIPKVTSADATMYWDSNFNSNGEISGILTTTDTTTAKTDYAGVSNTDKIRAIQSSTSQAAGYCYSKTLTIGGVTKHGYLGSCGEWYLAWQNKSAIDTALLNIGSQALQSSYYWTSTLYPYGFAWFLSWYSSEDVSFYDKNFSVYVRPFYDLR